MIGTRMPQTDEIYIHIAYSSSLNLREIKGNVSNFQCLVCGAIFTTDEDRKQHLEKESRGELFATSDQEKEIAKSQEAINESRRHI